MKKAQAIIEYAVIISVVMAALIAACVYIQGIVPPIITPPKPEEYEYLDKLCYGISAYGKQEVYFSAGEVKRYYIPIDVISKGMDLGMLSIDTYSLGTVAGGDISIKLISPSGLEWVSDSPTTSDESINVLSKSYAQSNYPFDNIEKGNWILEVTAKENSRVRIWVRHDRM